MFPTPARRGKRRVYLSRRILYRQRFCRILAEFKTLDELKAAYTAGGIGDMKCKKLLNSVLNKMLDPIRKRRQEFEQDIPEIYNILKKGSEAARETAAQTLSEVKAACR